MIVRLKEGDKTAFVLLFHFYYPDLVMYAKQFTTDRMEAEEIVQEFFVRFWQKYQQIIPSNSLKNYLLQIPSQWLSNDRLSDIIIFAVIIPVMEHFMDFMTQTFN